MIKKFIEAARKNETVKALRTFFLVRFTAWTYYILAFFIAFFIETCSRHSIREAAVFLHDKPLVFLYNTTMIFATFSIAYLVRRRKFLTFFISIIWVAGGIANGVILTYRTTPFTGPDLTVALNALTLIHAYLSTDRLVLTVVGLVFGAIALLVAWFQFPKRQQKVRYKVNILVVIGIWVAFLGLTKLYIEQRILSTYFGNIAFAYQDYGFPYCFSVSLFATGIDCPNDYSEELMTKIQNSYEEETTPEDVNKPNIIFLQLESFFDPKYVRNLELSEDPIPTFTKLKEEFSSGFLTVPSVGAGTANTEFEIMSGMSLHYFGPGEYPYKTVLKENTCESIVYSLADIGYATHAIHNNEANFYSRNTVFSNLGFDSFTSEEYMNITEYTPMGWAKDSCLVDEITKALDSTEQEDFIYTISVQGHGGYPSEQVLDDPEIKVGGLRSEASQNSFEYYVNEIYEMDQFISDLIDTLSSSEEDIVLVMYGDHLPALNLTADDLENYSLYQTEYVIWNNMDLDATHKSLKAYQLGAYVLDQLDIHEGTLIKYHQARMNTKNYLPDLEALQYDMLYGKMYVYGGESPFEPTAMRMGVEDITLTKVTRLLNKEVIITGENFTKASQVSINGELVDTQYVDENTLKLRDCELQKGDEIAVNQICDGYGVLSTSNVHEMTN